MKYKVMEIAGVLLMVLGVALVIVQLLAKEKSVIGSIAAGATPITVGSILIRVSQRLEQKKRIAIEQSATHK